MPTQNGGSIHPICGRTLFLFAALTLFSVISSIGQSPQFRWSTKAGGDSHDYGTSIAADPLGNTYVTGYFRDESVFDGKKLEGKGESDIFIAKYNRVGNLVWAHSMGGEADDMARGITLDSSGNVYICGAFLSPEVDFGGQVIKKQADLEIFVAKFNPEGNLIWARSGGSGPGGTANDVAVDLEGNVFVTGYFLGQGIFEDLTLENSGYVDIFVARYDPDGGLVWVRQIGGRSDDVASSIVADEQGSVYIAGAFSEQMRVSRGIRLESEGLFDAFIMKLDSEGRTAWAVEEGGYMNDVAYDLAIDPAGNLILTGGYAGSESFASEFRLHAGYRKPRRRYRRAYFGRKRLTSNGGSDIFIAKYNPAGRLVWVQSVGGNKQGAPEAGYSIAVDARGHSHITGTFAGRVMFGNNTLVSRGVGDVYVMELDRDGRVLWVRQAGTQYGAPNVGYGIAVDRGGSSYVTGYFGGNANFGNEMLKSTRATDTDIFVAKITAAFIPQR